MSTVFKRDPLGDMPNFLDEFYKRARNTYVREMESRLREICELYEREYIPERIVMVSGPEKEELYYYQTDTGSLEPLVALAPLEVSFNESSTGSSMEMKYAQQVLHPDIFKPVR